MSSNVTWFDGVTYSVPAGGEVNWSSLSSFLIALGQKASITVQMKQAIRKAVSSPVTVSATTDCIISTKLTVAGAVTVNLPGGTDGLTYFIVDGTGDAATNNVTINRSGSDTIEGATTLVLDHNNQGAVLAYNLADTDWKVLVKTRVSSVQTGDLAAALLVPVGKGGTGVTTLASNGVLYGNAATNVLALAVNSTGTNKFLTQSSSAAPAWAALVAGDVPLVGQSARGAVSSAGQLLGTNTNDNASTSNVGEYVSASPGGAVNVATSSGNWRDVTSVSLTAGDWDVSGTLVISYGTIATNTYIAGAVTTTSNSGAAGGASIDQGAVGDGQSQIGNQVSSPYLPVPVRRFSLSGTTTVYLSGNVNFSSVGTATYTVNSIIRARRVR